MTYHLDRAGLGKLARAFKESCYDREAGRHVIELNNFLNRARNFTVSFIGLSGASTGAYLLYRHFNPVSVDIDDVMLKVCASCFYSSFLFALGAWPVYLLVSRKARKNIESILRNAKVNQQYKKTGTLPRNMERYGLDNIN